jgi:hypothetical protein
MYTRVRFKANAEDPRPVSWPISFPFWVTGYGDDHATIVAYIPIGHDVETYWPEAEDIEQQDNHEKPEYTDRFPKPDWMKP